MSAPKSIVLVTGGNNGIGLAGCQLFAAQPNYHCIMGSRSREKGQQAISSIQSSTPGAAISLVQLDITSDASIAAAVAEVKAQHGHLDILINNAGVCPTDFSRSTLRDCLETNAISPAMVTEAFAPILLLSAAPRVVYVSSAMGSISQRCDPGNQAYSADYKVYRTSKAALNMIVACDAWQYEGKMKVFAYCPGYVVTDLAGERAEKEKAGFAKSPDGSARGLLNIADGKRDGENGMFLHDEKFTTTIDGLAFYFQHLRSPRAAAIPLLLTHEWPGSVLEFRHVAAALTGPADDSHPAFHLVVPALPGYVFSAKPKTPGWDYVSTARAWAELMRRLGYANHPAGLLAQGGDWGAYVVAVLGHHAPAGLRGVHMNSVFMDVRKELATPCKQDAEGEARAKRMREMWEKEGTGYFLQQATRPQSLGYGLADSPVGLAAWMVEKMRGWAWRPEGGDVWDVFDKDEVLETVMLYWLTNSGTSSARYYWECKDDSTAWKIDLPVGVSWFPGDLSYGPKEWCERYYSNIVHWKELDRGGHFAAWEVPGLFVAEVREWASKE